MRISNFLPAYTLDMVDDMSFADFADVLGVMEGDAAVANLKSGKKGTQTLSG